jgi:hypothetical protein
VASKVDFLGSGKTQSPPPVVSERLFPEDAFPL